MKLTIRSLLVLSVAACLLAATDPAIGMAVARGSFRADNSRVYGNTTLFEGTRLATSQASLELRLQSGAQLGLAPASEAKVYRDHLVLERGRAEVRAAAAYGLEARGLRATPTAAHAWARIGFDERNRVLVAAVRGPVEVRNAAGLLLANLEEGRTLVFDPQGQQPGAAAPVKISGLVQHRDGHYLLIDEVSNVTFEVLGGGVEREVGNRVELSGVIDPTAKPFPPATQVVRVTKSVRLSAAAAGPGGWASLAPGAKAAIIGGVVVGATVGILAATDVIFKEEKPVSP